MSLTREDICLVGTGILYLADYYHKNTTVERILSDDGTITLRFTSPPAPKEIFDKVYQSCKESMKKVKE